jgi:hypothetical protein
MPHTIAISVHALIQCTIAHPRETQMYRNESSRKNWLLYCLLFLVAPAITYGQDSPNTGGEAAPASTPSPLISKGHPVDWWFVFKLNAGKFPGCGEDVEKSCAFGGSIQNYKSAFGQQFVYASSDNESLTKGSVCAGTTTLNDPIGATFDELYNRTDLYYVVWNARLCRLRS